MQGRSIYFLSTPERQQLPESSPLFLAPKAVLPSTDQLTPDNDHERGLLQATQDKQAGETLNTALTRNQYTGDEIARLRVFYTHSLNTLSNKALERWLQAQFGLIVATSQGWSIQQNDKATKIFLKKQGARIFAVTENTGLSINTPGNPSRNIPIPGRIRCVYELKEDGFHLIDVQTSNAYWKQILTNHKPRFSGAENSTNTSKYFPKLSTAAAQAESASNMSALDWPRADKIITDLTSSPQKSASKMKKPNPRKKTIESLLTTQDQAATNAKEFAMEAEKSANEIYAHPTPINATPIVNVPKTLDHPLPPPIIIARSDKESRYRRDQPNPDKRRTVFKHNEEMSYPSSTSATSTVIVVREPKRLALELKNLLENKPERSESLQRASNMLATIDENSNPSFVLTICKNTGELMAACVKNSWWPNKEKKLIYETLTQLEDATQTNIENKLTIILARLKSEKVTLLAHAKAISTEINKLLHGDVFPTTELLQKLVPLSINNANRKYPATPGSNVISDSDLKQYIETIAKRTNNHLEKYCQQHCAKLNSLDFYKKIDDYYHTIIGTLTHATNLCATKDQITSEAKISHYNHLPSHINTVTNALIERSKTSPSLSDIRNSLKLLSKTRQKDPADIGNKHPQEDTDKKILTNLLRVINESYRNPNDCCSRLYFCSKKPNMPEGIQMIKSVLECDGPTDEQKITLIQKIANKKCQELSFTRGKNTKDIYNLLARLKFISASSIIVIDALIKASTSSDLTNFNASLNLLSDITTSIPQDQYQNESLTDLLAAINTISNLPEGLRVIKLILEHTNRDQKEKLIKEIASYKLITNSSSDYIEIYSHISKGQITDATSLILQENPMKCPQSRI